MSRRPVGYYVHHRGAGHRARAEAIAPLLERPCTLIGTFDAPIAAGFSRLPLPDDAICGPEGWDGERTRPDALHYAPLGVDAIRTRMAHIAEWAAAHDPVMMIVDVSVEVALFARLLSIPTVVVRLAGDRTDRPHLEAFRAAERLIAPFPEPLESPATPPWIRAKTIYAGFLSTRAAHGPIEEADTARRITVVFGRGGTGGQGAAMAIAARALPEFVWDVLGPVDGLPDDHPPNLHLKGWVDDVDRHLASSCLVIGTGGDGVIAMVAAHGKRFVCIPEDRPFDEQRVKAEALQQMGAAICQASWKGPIDWRGLIEAGLHLDPSRLASLTAPGALARTALALDGIACDLERIRRRSLDSADPA